MFLFFTEQIVDALVSCVYLSSENVTRRIKCDLIMTDGTLSLILISQCMHELFAFVRNLVYLLGKFTFSESHLTEAKQCLHVMRSIEK